MKRNAKGAAHPKFLATPRSCPPLTARKSGGSGCFADDGRGVGAQVRVAAHFAATVPALLAADGAETGILHFSGYTYMVSVLVWIGAA
jgi:hypothetical protein